MLQSKTPVAKIIIGSLKQQRSVDMTLTKARPFILAVWKMRLGQEGPKRLLLKWKKR
jgi:hypothetical protein